MMIIIRKKILSWKYPEKNSFKQSHIMAIIGK